MCLIFFMQRKITQLLFLKFTIVNLLQKKNIVVKDNKLLKVFTCFNTSYFIVKNFYFVHKIIKKNLNFDFENTYSLFNLIVFQSFQIIKIVFRNQNYFVNSIIRTTVSIFLF